jgi:hypothetical protein
MMHSTYSTPLAFTWLLVQLAIHPIDSSASPVELRLRVLRALRAQWKKKRSKVSGGVEICLSVTKGEEAWGEKVGNYNNIG